MKRPEDRLTPGRKRLPTMPCGWGCGAQLTSTEMRGHFSRCPNQGAETVITVVRKPVKIEWDTPLKSEPITVAAEVTFDAPVGGNVLTVKPIKVERQEGQHERLVPMDEL